MLQRYKICRKRIQLVCGLYEGEKTLEFVPKDELGIKKLRRLSERAVNVIYLLQAFNLR